MGKGSIHDACLGMGMRGGGGGGCGEEHVEPFGC